MFSHLNHLMLIQQLNISRRHNFDAVHTEMFWRVLLVDDVVSLGRWCNDKSEKSVEISNAADLVTWWLDAFPWLIFFVRPFLFISFSSFPNHVAKFQKRRRQTVRVWSLWNRHSHCWMCQRARKSIGLITELGQMETIPSNRIVYIFDSFQLYFWS